MSAPAAAAAAFRGPLSVSYCSACTLPAEYCEYGPCWSKCKVLLEQSHPELLAAALERMSVGKGGAASSSIAVAASAAPAAAAIDDAKENETAKKTKNDDDSDSDDDDDADDDAPAASAGGDDEFMSAAVAAPVKVAKKSSALGPGIYLSIASRSKRKFITTIRGFESFGITLKDASKVLSKKFACAASVVKHADGSEIAIQGDLMQDLPHWLVDEYKQIEKKMVFTLDKAGKKKPILF